MKCNIFHPKACNRTNNYAGGSMCHKYRPVRFEADYDPIRECSHRKLMNGLNKANKKDKTHKGEHLSMQWEKVFRK